MENKTNTLILLRGLPGSGKSTLARILAEKGKYPVFSIDNYFTNSKGEYNFDYSKNHLAYKQCEQLTEEAAQQATAKIFIDNTFTLDWEMEPYFKIAQKYNYTIYVLTVEKYHTHKNVHGVSEEQIEKMAAKYKVKLL